MLSISREAAQECSPGEEQNEQALKGRKNLATVWRTLVRAT